MKRTLMGALAATALLGGLAACGHMDPDMGSMGGMAANMNPEHYAQTRDKMLDRAAGKLDLNADQKQRLVKLADAMHAQHMALMGAGQNPRAEMKALITGDKFDAVRAQALVTEKTIAINAKSPEVIAAMADFFNSLNATQQQKVRDFLDSRGRGMHRG